MSDADALKNAASAAPADLGENQESADLFGGMKKKKKDKKKLDLDLDLDQDDNKDSGAPVDADAPAAEDDELNVSPIFTFRPPQPFSNQIISSATVILTLNPIPLFPSQFLSFPSIVWRVEEEEEVKKEGRPRP